MIRNLARVSVDAAEVVQAETDFLNAHHLEPYAESLSNRAVPARIPPPKRPVAVGSRNQAVELARRPWRERESAHAIQAELKQ
jgi:hypothetical protein